MKKLFALTMLICLAMICSCQKQGSAAERQLAQRKAELDARAKALNEREKALAERANPTASAHLSSPDLKTQGKVSDPEQAKAEMERRLQQLPPEAQRLIPDPALKAEKKAKLHERVAEKKRRLEEVKKMGPEEG